MEKQKRSPREVCGMFMKTDRLHRKAFEGLVSRLGIHRSQHIMLMHLAKDEGTSQKALAEHLQISDAAVAVTIKKLEAGEGCVRTRQVQKGFCGAFCKKRPLVPAGTRRFLCELSFAPFVSKESGVPNCALQNRCKPTEIKLSKPLVHFFFLKPKAQKEKCRLGEFRSLRRATRLVQP